MFISFTSILLPNRLFDVDAVLLAGDILVLWIRWNIMRLLNSLYEYVMYMQHSEVLLQKVKSLRAIKYSEYTNNR